MASVLLMRNGMQKSATQSEVQFRERGAELVLSCHKCLPVALALGHLSKTNCRAKLKVFMRMYRSHKCHLCVLFFLKHSF